MQTLYPPDYPDHPGAPLLSFGLAFSEEISRSVVFAVFRENPDQPHEADVRIAASLTMLEAFHPRDHLECMMAAQGVACHAQIMECYGQAMRPDITPSVAAKLRANVAQLSRTFSTNLRDLERRQSKPLPERPPPRLPEGPPTAGPDDGPPPVDAPADHNDTGMTPPDDAAEAAALLNDMATRPDGSLGSLAAYLPKVPVMEFVPREPPIMTALATRPKPWRMVNAPPDGEPVIESLANAAANDPAPAVSRGPLDPHERIFTGDAVARFTSARQDPDAPVAPLSFADEAATFELELISTGGDPEAEAERAAMIAAHPEGKPIVTFHYGTRKPPDKPPRDP